MSDQTEPDQFDVGQVMAYWLAEAEESLQVAEHLMEKADYSYALFFGHLAIEKALKAVYAYRRREHAPPLHNLLRLAKLAGLELEEARADTLITITAFNIEARYPDIKRAFRQKCTVEYTTHQMSIIREMFLWLRFTLQ